MIMNAILYKHLYFPSLVFSYMIHHAVGLCYYEKCHCPEGNELDLETPGSELLIKLQHLRRRRSMNNFEVQYSKGRLLRTTFYETF